MFDLVIRNGVIVDGTGAPSYRGDVGVIGDRIAEIGRLSERGREEVDAEGHVVTPGFVDGHTHMDAQLNWDPLGTSSCWHGVTTVVMGNCGFTIAPSKDGERELVVRNLERAEAISAEAMAAGIRWDWETFPEYLDTVDRLPKGMNHSVYVGHSALRTWAMGERAFEETASDDDLKLMCSQLGEALEAGAIGLSTSRSPNHETSDERPVASRLASWDEVRHLVGTMGDLGAGIFEIANEDLARASDPELRAGYLNQLRALSAETGIPVTFGVQVIYEPDEWRAQLSALGPTDGGGRLFGQCNSRPTNSLRSFRTFLPFDHMPEWREVRQLPLEAQKPLLRDPEVRARLVHAAQHGEYARFVGPAVRKPDWDTVLVYDKPLPPYRTVSEVAAARNVDPVEALIDLALESDFDTLFMHCSKGWNPAGAVEVMSHPFTVMTFSDAGAHVSQICDASIHTSFLGYWVREQEVFELEQAVRMITSVPAREWGFSDRGQLREGLAADINVFDPDHIGPEMPKAVADLPAGARRLVIGATGIKATVVNGRTTIRDGSPTGELAGRFLRGPLAANATN